MQHNHINQSNPSVSDILYQLYAIKAPSQGFIIEKIIGLEIPDAWEVMMIDLLVWGAWRGIQDGSIARNDAAQLAFRSLTHGLMPVSLRDQ